MRNQDEKEHREKIACRGVSLVAHASMKDAIPLGRRCWNLLDASRILRRGHPPIHDTTQQPRKPTQAFSPSSYPEEDMGRGSGQESLPSPEGLDRWSPSLLPEPGAGKSALRLSARSSRVVLNPLMGNGVNSQAKVWGPKEVDVKTVCLGHDMRPWQLPGPDLGQHSPAFLPHKA